MSGKTVVKASIAEQFARFLEHGRVFLFSAPCGFGKTTTAEALLAGRRVRCVTAGEAGFALPEADGTWEILLVDDLQQMQEAEEQQTLCGLIREHPELRFVLLTRGAPPGWLAAFQYAGVMTTVDADDMLFDREEIRRMFQLSGVTVTESELTGVLKNSIGYPLGVAITVRCMEGGKPYTSEMIAQAFQEVFLYFETAIYQRFDLPVRRFLLELAPFEQFDPEMARMVSGDPRAGELLDWLQRNTTMLRYDGILKFHFWPQFRRFLLWEMDREYTDEKRKTLFSRGGLYYELHEDYPHALECYTMGGDHSKVSDLLIRSTELHPGMGQYSELEKYYRSLPESELLTSPSLMQGMSMLCALSMDYEGSERWYKALEQFAGRCGRGDAAGKQARSRLAWLDISLPQRSVDKLTETFPAVFRLMTNTEVVLPPFSVTSCLPSIMNGGKDFSPWSKKDDLLYQTLRRRAGGRRAADGRGPAGAFRARGADAVPAQYGRAAVPHRPSDRRSGRGGRLVPRKSAARPDPCEHDEAVSISDAGDGGAVLRQAGCRAADDGGAAVVQGRLRAVHRRHPSERGLRHRAVSPEGRDMARGTDRSARHRVGVPIHPHDQRVWRGCTSVAG